MSQTTHPAGITGSVHPVPLSEFPLSGGSSFFSFIMATKTNRWFLWATLIGSILQLTLFKLFYPFPDFISDSYNYIESAQFHLNANLWPIGYARFIEFIHQVHYSDTLLITIQYILVQASLLYFFYSVKYLYRPSAGTTRIIYIVLLFNPIFLYLSNCVLSDALFTSITVTWLTLLLWQIQFPNRKGLVIQVILIGLAFTLRYTAMYYPLVAAVALLFVPMRRLEKIAWMAAPLLLIIPFILFTKAETKKVTGTAEFSVFGGWQIANNALYMYADINVDSTDLPPEARKLDQMVKDYYKAAPPGFFNFEDFPGTFFIKHQHAPLKQYMVKYYRKDIMAGNFQGWGKVSPMYNKYGTWLILHHPIAFTKDYLWLNTKNYFYPFLEKFGSYNVMEDSVWDGAKDWFHYPSLRISSVSKEFQGRLFFAYPPLFLILNLYFAGCLLWLALMGKFKLLDLIFQRALLLLAAFLLINFGFSILATPVVLRYQIVPMLLLFTFSFMLMEFTDKKEPAHE